VFSKSHHFRTRGPLMQGSLVLFRTAPLNQVLDKHSTNIETDAPICVTLWGVQAEVRPGFCLKEHVNNIVL